MTPSAERSAAPEPETSRPSTTIVHLAVEYNTPLRQPTTMAVDWFVSELTDYHNVVIAMRRTIGLRDAPPVECATPAGRLFDLPFFGLPLGIGLHRAMRRAASRIIALLEQQGIRPSLVHAHKYTFEGLAGWYVARHFDVPLFVSLRGEVETKVFRAKPLLRPFLRRIAQDAARLYFVSAWFEPMFHAYVPGVGAKARRLPNIVRNIAPTITITPPVRSLVSVFNLDTHRRKGLSWLLDAMLIAVREEPEIALDIIGGGSPDATAHCTAMIARRCLGASVHLVGALPNAGLLRRLAEYRGFVLPSLNETFGMVYIESLFAGVPVLHTAGTAVDRYLDDLGVSIAAAPRDSREIASGLLDLWRHPARFRENIARAAPQLFATFDPAVNIARYCDDVDMAISQANGSARHTG